MKQTRREFLKTNAAAATAAVAGITLPGVQQAMADVTLSGAQQALPGGGEAIRWDKAACRFCGTGCSVLVGVKDGRVVATQGDPDAPVNRGLNCIKGYFLSKIMYGKDRLTKPLLRKKNGKFDKEGEFEEVSWEEAFTLMADKWKEALKRDMEANKGKAPEEMISSVGMFGSGQWLVWEGYAANKLWKAGFRSNNIDPNARHCMASAVAGFMRTFGMDEPMGCYDDLEHADGFVLWGANMAEMHPVLWSRLTDRRLTNPHVKVAVLSTFEHRSFELADLPVIFKPQTDLAILNYICNYIIQNNAVNTEWVDKHVVFKKGVTNIGYGLRPNHPLEKVATNNGYPGEDGKPKGDPNKMEDISFDDFKAFVSEYTAEKVSELSGVPKEQLEELAQMYTDPKRKVVSYWTMGFNQHTRGTWVNNMIYNVHLLVGKISEPGNGPFSLTGQPSACGTAREVGTFAHRLPADMVVANKDHRAFAEKVWKLPEGTLNGKVGFHAVLQSRMLKDGKLVCYWTTTTNNMQAGPNINDEIWPGWRNPKTFIVVSDAYPTVSALSADLILPCAMWTEKEGAFGNAERRTQFWRQQVKAPGDARSDLWQYIEFSKYFKVEDVWPEDLIAKMPELQGQDPVRRPVCERPGRQVREGGGQGRSRQRLSQRRDGPPRLLPAEGALRGVPRLRRQQRVAEEGPRPRRLRVLPQGARRALAGGESQGDAVALPRGLRPVRRGRQRLAVLWQQEQEGEHHRAALRPAGRVAGRRVRPVALHRPRARALAHRHHDPARPRAAPRGPGRGGLHEPGGRREARAQARHGLQGREPPGRDRAARRDHGP